MQKILTLIIAAMIIYNIASKKLEHDKTDISNQSSLASEDPELKHESTNHSNQKTEMTGSLFERTISTLMLNVLSTQEGKTILQKIVKPQYPERQYSSIKNQIITSNKPLKTPSDLTVENIFHIETFGPENEEGPAICGHSVRVKYKIYTADDHIIVDEGIKLLTLGTREILLGLDNVIVGMYNGQTRIALIPAEFTQTQNPSKKKMANTAYKVEVKLLDIIPKTFIKDNEIRLFHDNQTSDSIPYLCGTQGRINLKISKINGEIIYNTENTQNTINMLIGAMNYPIVMSYALFNKSPKARHVAIAQGKYFRSFGNKNSNQIFPNDQLPDDEFFIMEISPPNNNLQ